MGEESGMSDAHWTELVMGPSNNLTSFFVGGGVVVKEHRNLEVILNYLQIDSVNST